VGGVVLWGGFVATGVQVKLYIERRKARRASVSGDAWASSPLPMCMHLSHPAPLCPAISSHN
jgi:hypothetical protein